METTTNNFHPGLLGPDVEIFNHPAQGLKILSDGQVKPFSQAPFSIIAILLEAPQ